MEQLLIDLKQRGDEDWLIGYDSREFTQQAVELYLHLKEKSHRDAPPKIILAERNPIKFIAGFIAATAANCPVFLCNPDWVESEWQQVFELVQPDLILGQEAQAQSKLFGHSLPITNYPLPITHAPIMIPTGGSSGKIRFAIHTWETLIASLRGFKQYFDVKQVNSFCVLPLYHVSGLMQFMRSFATGGRLVILPFKALELGNKTDIKPAEYFISLVPTQLQRLLQQESKWLSEFATVLLGGAPAWTELLETARNYRIRLAPTYGMTETASQIVTLKPDDFLKGNNSCGQVLPHVTVTICSAKGEILAPRNTGNIAIKSKSLFLGYYPEENQIKTTFQPDDLGYFDEKGYLHIIGRNSNKIITGGENVFPSEVEAAIQSTNLVIDVCVIGLPDRHWGQVVTAIYIPKHPKVSTDILKTALEDKLCKFKRPKYWFPVESLPRNAQGKVNREKLKKLSMGLIANSSC
ncbi:2-succinylbenzoate--CoA ligase [Microseira wollei]|uniref:O-succinylbenzoic acid--CoA ligase n=1 Tax=Microseira wollei NIES-4236 TaxID=2530354 RepID=A0AAV3XR77_9CYAN|nr:2-succinylbenzoate--CoA ligase [Microseira wollei]GET43087.1 O-succinylbenzoic acid--CoA ligase [Microseira wollei NIES-4236]